MPDRPDASITTPFWGNAALQNWFLDKGRGLARHPGCPSADTFHRALSIALIVATVGCDAAQRSDASPASSADTASTTITYRQFSASPSLARGQGSPDPRGADYGALSIFLEKVETKTDALGAGKRVTFTLSAGVPTLGEVADRAYDAGHVSGGSLNGVWGFLFNSVPFGPSFSQMIDFLNAGNGIVLANQALERRAVDVVAFPVVGSPAQLSGYFKKPVGTPECSAPGDEACRSYGNGIGLAGLCSEAWTIRYLPPAETVLDTACDDYDAPQRLSFVQAIPGGSAFLTALQRGTVDGMEFATALDDFDATKGGFFQNASEPEGSDGRNAGEIGLRYLHYPAWHQPFFLGWMLINKSQVWDVLDADQQAAIEEAAREAVVESFNASTSLQCEHLQRILDINNDRRQQLGEAGGSDLSADMVPTEWAANDLERLRNAASRIFEDTKGGDSPSDDETDYATIVATMHQHLGHESIAGMLGAWTPPGFPIQEGCN